MKTSSPSIFPFSRNDSLVSISFYSCEDKASFIMSAVQWRDSQNQRVCVVHSPEFRPSLWWLFCFVFFISTFITLILFPIQKKHIYPSCFPFSHNVSWLSKDLQHPPARTYFIPNNHYHHHAYIYPWNLLPPPSLYLTAHSLPTYHGSLYRH